MNVAADIVADRDIVGRPVPASVDEVVETYRRWLYLPDAGALLAMLAAVVANRSTGDPVWLLLVSPASGGKTELLASLTELEDVWPAATLTPAALLSGTAAREKAQDARGGLLRAIGDFGILTLKDFGSILSMHREGRAELLAALRELYDGAWTRHVGTDGGRTLHWEGKLGLLAGCTPAIDRHHAVMASLGERFCMYRLDQDDPDEQARRSLAHAEREPEMRAELRDVVRRLFAARPLALASTHSEADRERLVALSTLVVRARSPVERDTYVSREIELIPAPEAPGRLVGVLSRLLAGLRALGIDDGEAWRIVTKVGLDSMPAQRREVLEYLIGQGDERTTTQVATTLGYPASTAKRVLEDLNAHGLLGRSKQGEGETSPNVWRVDPWTVERFARAGGLTPAATEGGGGA